MAKYRLQLRITTLIAGTALLLIVVFSTIQLRSQIDKLKSYNKYRARVGTIIVKTTLEMLIKEVDSREALVGIFNAAVLSFSREGVVEKISIISPEGEAIATNDPVLRMFGETKKDLATYSRLSEKTGKDAWFYSTINENTKNIDIYIPIYVTPELTYIAKLSFSIGNVHQAMVDILLPVMLTAVAVIIGNILLAFVLSRTVVRPIDILYTATKDITSGNLDRRVEIRTHDEIEELGETFNAMTVALKKMKERAENANPLTGLPGNNIIREEVESRIFNKQKFVAIHIDLDNFKAYNDRYGIAKGDEVIRFTSDVIRRALDEKGGKEDFIGHEGGDDFFVITTLDESEAIADKVTRDFDARIREFYTKEDQHKGFIYEKSRTGEMMKFPIMTISLAGITNAYKTIASYGELTNIAVGVKHKVKEVRKSTFILDRRKE